MDHGRVNPSRNTNDQYQKYLTERCESLVISKQNVETFTFSATSAKPDRNAEEAWWLWKM